MPDLFDNFFNKIGTKLNGGRSTHHYGGSSQVNSGSYYSYHQNGTNNKYWMTKQQVNDNKIEIVGGADAADHDQPRRSSLVGVAGYMTDKGDPGYSRSRFSSVSSETSETD